MWGRRSGTSACARSDPLACVSGEPATTFAVTLRTSTNAISTSAAAHPAACSPGSGDSEKTKIVTGSVGSASVTFVETWFAAIDEVKSSGAVSPATRATEITTPVRIPLIALGRMMLHVVRHFVTPSARLASRRLRGITPSTSCVARATIGSIRIASAKAP